ncbi:uncharacterized protein ATNIH1004_003507 [Aspergillus tanneri]|uniref:Aldehyde dehydrogenase domain-containing protein n=1 Tax=Aspergillus tanneri TaxID=1220188 RepID=A0A5M9MVA9_9EURO|nr:uncharacterized protein ATNIH1004_003507 [Aspergillus tanneri]KAA8650818.1 hypothetical protein ATNIH1004_003507 [Aspergillus tanneri]
MSMIQQQITLSREFHKAQMRSYVLVESAEKAFPAWRATSIMARQQILFKFVNLIRANWDRLAAAITLEQGKTLLMPEKLREPLAICSFSFPAMIPLWCLPIATVTGNCPIMKPSERDPGAAMILAELAKEAAFPPGVINIVHGTTRAVDYIIDEPAIKAISVGSNRAGEYIYTCGSANGKRVQANLSAKNHAALLPDCNKNHALNAITPLLVQLVSARAIKLNVNGGFEDGSDLGPVITREQEAVPTLDDAINLINANEYGNGAAVFTTSGPIASKFQKDIEAGQQGINVPIPVPLPMFSFTGNKKSMAGGGANTFYGKPGLQFYTQQKMVTSLWHSEDASSTKASVIMPTQS